MRDERTIKLLYAKKALRFLLTLLVFVITGCAKNYNNEIATYEVVNDRYHITFTGMRGNMDHAPISLIFRGSSEVSEVIDVSRISEKVTGSEIPTNKGHYKYLGLIRFDDDQMVVDLKYDNYDDNTTPDSCWNGSYILASITQPFNAALAYQRKKYE